MSLALVIITAVLYWPVRHFDFVQYDDDDYVFNNQNVLAGVKWDGLVWSVVDAHVANWHPLTWVSHMLDCQLFGLDPGPHHVVNVLWHCANSVLLFLLMKTMTGTFWRSAFVAALFAWHPLRVESVAWISERKDVLSGFFFMLTLWTYAFYAKRQEVLKMCGDPQPVSHGRADSPPPPKGSVSPFWFSPTAPFLYKLSLFFFLLGLLSKPMLVTVPFILLLIDFWPLKRFEAPSGLFRVRADLLREKIPFVVLSMVVALFTFLAQKASGAMVSLHSEGIGSRIGNVLTGYAGYLEKLVWPHHLAVLYLRPWPPPLLTIIAGAFMLLGVSAIAFMNLRRRPYLVVGWLWFVVMLLPVSGLVQVGLQSMADRYTYLSAVGLGFIASWGVCEAMGSLFPPGPRQLLLASAGCVVLAVCVGLTRQQLGYWRNTETLMEHALQVDPNNYVAHQNLGVYYSRLGLTEVARAHRQRVRELDPVLRRYFTSATNSVPLHPGATPVRGNARNDE